MPEDGPPSTTPRASRSVTTRPNERALSERKKHLSEAIEEYVVRHDPEAVTDAMNRVAEAVDTRPDPALAGTARSILEHTEW